MIDGSFCFVGEGLAVATGTQNVATENMLSKEKISGSRYMVPPVSNFAGLLRSLELGRSAWQNAAKGLVPTMTAHAKELISYAKAPAPHRCTSAHSTFVHTPCLRNRTCAPRLQHGFSALSGWCHVRTT